MIRPEHSPVSAQASSTGSPATTISPTVCKLAAESLSSVSSAVCHQAFPGP